MARFAVDHANDRSASTWIAVLLSLTYSTLTLAVRVAVKVNLLGLDDASIAVAYLLSYSQQATMIYDLLNGFGHDLSRLGHNQQIDAARVKCG